MLSLNAKFMTPLKGQQRVRRLAFPNSRGRIKVGGWGGVKGKEGVGKGVRKDKRWGGKGRDSKWERSADGCGSNA